MLEVVERVVKMPKGMESGLAQTSLDGELFKMLDDKMETGLSTGILAKISIRQFRKLLSEAFGRVDAQKEASELKKEVGTLKKKFSVDDESPTLEI